MSTELAYYDEVVHRIYDAALEPSKWPAALARIADACRGSRSVLFTPAHSPTQGGFVFSYNLPQANIERWAAKSRLEDPFVRELSLRGLMREGLAGHGAELVSNSELFGSAFYQELWAPIDIAHVCFGMVFDGTDGHKVPTIISVYRRLSDPPFDRHQVDLLKRLLAHLSRALGVMFHLRDTRLQVASTLAALNRLSAGVLLLDAQGHVQFTNVAAHRLLGSTGPLQLLASVSHRAARLKLIARLSEYEEHLRQALTEALSPPGADVGHFSKALLLPDEEGKPAFVLHAAALGEALADESNGQLRSSHWRAIVLLYDLATARSVPPNVLCQLFDLTRAEARAALQVALGGSVEEMAQRLGIAANTFKTQLQAAYAKTNTHRQVDLLKLLLALAAV